MADDKPSLYDIENAIITLVKDKLGDNVVVRDAEFDVTKQGWQEVLIPEPEDITEVHAVVISVLEYPQRRTGSDKVIEPIFGIDFMRQYQLGAAQRKAFYDEFELVSDYISRSADLGLDKRIAGHDELQGTRIGTRTIVGVKLRVFPTTLKVRLQPFDVVFP
jgi:hypothetical protein